MIAPTDSMAHQLVGLFYGLMVRKRAFYVAAT